MLMSRLTVIVLSSLLLCATATSPALGDDITIFGVQPGTTQLTDFLTRGDFAALGEKAKTRGGWTIVTCRASTGDQFTLTSVNGIIRTVDVDVSGFKELSEVLQNRNLGRPIPAHQLPEGAFIGPTVSRLWGFTRTTSGAIVFSRVTAEAAFPLLVRHFSNGPAVSPATSRTPQLGAKLSVVPVDTSPKTSGIQFQDVIPQSLIWEMGFDTGDVLTNFDGQPMNSVDRFHRTLSNGNLRGRHSAEVRRNGRTTMLDLDLPEELARQLSSAVKPVAIAALPPREPKSTAGASARAATFQGITPGVTTEQELLTNPRWGRPLNRDFITDSLSSFQYRVAKYDVRVSVWCGIVQCIDINLNEGAAVTAAMKLFGLQNERPDLSLPLEALAGHPVPATRQPRLYQDKCVVLFVEFPEKRPLVKTIRLYPEDPGSIP